MVLGFPRYPSKQVHLWNPFTIWHSVFGPQGDGSQGLTGDLQGTCGGLPIKLGKQKHVVDPATTLQPEFGPQGLGSHTSPSGTEKINCKF